MMLGWLRRFLAAMRPQRREFQFSLRTLLIVMLLVAIGLAWWLDRRQMDVRLRRLEDRMFPQPSSGGNWGTEQATGPPDTKGSGDIPTAWASETPDGQQEWLLLKYAKAVQPSAVVIHETYNPGAVTKVCLLDANALEVVVWSGTDPTGANGAGRGVFTVPVQVNFKTSAVKIYLDSPKFPGWNEIDAVGLQHGWGWFTETTWAAQAQASSTYGQSRSTPPYYGGPKRFIETSR
jgi:hypothetical protein